MESRLERVGDAVEPLCPLLCRRRLVTAHAFALGILGALRGTLTALHGLHSLDLPALGDAVLRVGRLVPGGAPALSRPHASGEGERTAEHLDRMVPQSRHREQDDEHADEDEQSPSPPREPPDDIAHRSTSAGVGSVPDGRAVSPSWYRAPA
uniref:Uncharacterized protein n=1 Tax=uncultured marine virus TaxID=186617 RepID=A0A0F7L670_9VIRU|nr:hypothetical protein [uncultured marine virus]